MSKKLLLSSTTAPAIRIQGWAATDQMAYRLTRGQGPFRLYQHTHASGLHLLAQNVSCASVVLENPTEQDFADELQKEYEFVAISFDPLNAERMLAMCEQVRIQAPRSKVLLGGVGVICLSELSGRRRLADEVHSVCHGEGVGFLRALLGESATHQIKCQLPKEGASLPWLNPRPIGTNGVILSGLGCSQRCPFCATSAYTSGRYVEVMDAAQIFAAMKSYWAHTPFTASVSIYDENFLDQQAKVEALGHMIRADADFGLSRLNYSAFGSISALDKYEPEELLLAGLDKVWCGVESKFSSLAKRQGSDPADVFSRLQAVGIKTIGSWIIGQKRQHPGNIQEDMDYFISLDPCFQQLSVLGVVPGTPLWDQYAVLDRIPAKVDWSEYHLYGETFRHDRFSHQQMLEHLDDMYDRINREKGPALMKVLETNLNGYETCLASRYPALRMAKARYFADLCTSYHPLIKTALDFAPSARVRGRIEEIDKRYRELLGEPSPQAQRLAEQIASRAEQVYNDQQRTAATYEEPFRSYSYPPLAARIQGRPYRVEYPNRIADLHRTDPAPDAQLLAESPVP